MKKYLLSFFILIIASSFISVSFSQIVNAIKSGKSEEVAKYFDNNVEITFTTKTSSYSKSQAALVLHEFFENNPVKSFQVLHQSENDGSQYCIGNLSTTNGVFRTTIFIKQKGDKQLVQELRFEK